MAPAPPRGEPRARRYITAELEVRGADDDRPLPTWEELDKQEEELSDLLGELKALNEANYDKADEAMRLVKKAATKMDALETQCEELDQKYATEVAAKIAEEKAKARPGARRGARARATRRAM